VTQTARTQPETSSVISARPSTAWYWVAGIVLVVGVAAGIVVGILGYLDALDEYDNFPRLAAPGATEVVVDDPGDLVIYHQGSTLPSLAEFELSVTGPSGAVAVEPYESTLIFETGEGRARALASFEAVDTGTYRVEAQGTATGHLAVGPSWAWVALPAVLGGLAIVGVSVIAGVAIWLTTIIRRSNAKARASRAAMS
jgi:hypothetical protein